MTSDWTLIRLIGNDLDPSDKLRLQNWATKISDWRKCGPKRVYLFFHQPDDHLTIEFARLGSKVFTEMKYEGLPNFFEYRERDLFNF